MSRRLALLAALVAAGVSLASAEPTALFQIDFSNPALIPAQWTLEIHPDGSGHFRSVRGNAIPTQDIEPPNIDRDIQVSTQFAQHVFQVAERKRLFHGGCESHLNVAYQGTKKLLYQGPAGEGSCEFNYSKDNDIQNLGDSLMSVANTLIEGARLQTLLQHDRLGLDRETEVLVESANDGRAQQIGSIRDILERLVDDPSVLDRVKRRARLLLSKAND
ncbi:MAG TPA: hypothetical protein VG267_02115 [Terracidiphilus sp.]|jgi:hypothetical protein|nr:hypothetical protein [Terracidiphilus sp.]